MSKEILGIICTGSEGDQLRTLDVNTETAVMQIGGRYRIIDFALSNLINSGIRDIAILTRQNCRPVLEYVGSGKEWDLDRKKGGLTILPATGTSEFGNFAPRGMLDELKNAEEFIYNSRHQYCLITRTAVIYNEDYLQMIAQHEEKQADITIMYNEEESIKEVFFEPEEKCYFSMDEEERVSAIEYRSTPTNYKARGIDCILMKKEILLYLLGSVYTSSLYRSFYDVLNQNISQLRVFGYKHEGYAARISSVSNYFKANMDMLKYEVQAALFYGDNKIYTRGRDEVPSKYGDDAVVENSLIASGCVIEGTVENSILFRGVNVGKNARIRNAIVMQNGQVNDNALIDKVILERNAVIRPNSKLIGNVAFPVVIPKGGIA